MNVIRKTRESRGWSRAELARRAGLNASTVGSIENGRMRPYDCQLLKLADALDLGERQVGTLFHDFGAER